MSKPYLLLCIDSSLSHDGPKIGNVYPGREGTSGCYNCCNNNSWYKSRFIELESDKFQQQIPEALEKLDNLIINRCLDQASAHFGIPLQNSNPDIPMNYDNKPLANATFINGRDLADFTEADCLDHIARLKSEIANYQNVGVSSKTLDLRVTEREEALKVVVAKLDSLSD